MRNALDVRGNGRASLGLWDEFDRMFENYFTTTPTTYSSSRLLRPAYDIEETDTNFVLSFDLPGMKQEDINIEVKDRVLSISGERKREETKYLLGHRASTMLRLLNTGYGKLSTSPFLIQLRIYC